MQTSGLEKVDTQTIENNLEKLKQITDSMIPNDIYFKITLMKLPDLVASIRSLDTTKSTGLDRISPKTLKSAVEIVTPNVLQIINISIQTGQFPDVLKLAKLKPFFKSGLKSDPSNYRPVSILPVVSKIIEKHVTKHLFAFLNKYQLLHQSQSGFR